MPDFDVAVVGGGIMGCATALQLAQHGMRVVVIERRRLGMEASGMNAGTLSLQIKRAALVPYALRGYELWKTMAARFGMDVGFHVRGGLTIAFTETEAEVLVERMGERRAAGVPLEIVSPARALEIEPGLSHRLVLASHCALDGYANSNLTGAAFRKALLRAGATVREGEAVSAIDRDGGTFVIRAGEAVSRAARVVLAGGAWLDRLVGFLGFNLPLHCRVNMVSVTERCPPIVRAMVGHALGLLTLKQSDNGTVLIGGGWQGTGDRDGDRATEVIPENLLGNMQLAVYAVPALVHTRLVRTWHGFEAHVPDFLPLAGALPGIDNAFVIGCVRGGYTIGPYMGQLLGDLILGRRPGLPLFDPGRYIHRPMVALTAP
ncbi:MAG: FAD-binding oxidoreductase [Acidobacteria bacterium]|nr:FAD-binding oxidoreductase [Acidobacteriota bacterium]